MSNLKIKDWNTWQSYRSDRGTPPWIKVHRSLMSNQKWAQLSDAEKGQIVSIWIIAAEKDGVVTGDAKLLQKMCQLDKKPDIKKFVELGFLTPDDGQRDANLTPSRRQSDRPETETETETETEEERDSPLPPHAASPPPDPPDLGDQVAVEVFRQAFPKKSGSRSEILTAYANAKKRTGVTDEQLANHAASYAKHCQLEGISDRYRTAPAKWLDGDGWLNDYETTSRQRQSDPTSRERGLMAAIERAQHHRDEF